jgi:protein-serine/threonine kinase
MIMGTPHDSSVDWWTFGILLYEMLVCTAPGSQLGSAVCRLTRRRQFGTTPFVGKTMTEAFRSIVACQLQFPKTCARLHPISRVCADGGAARRPVVSRECRELISQLLVKGKRLGSEHGAADIKKHRFFKSIDWERIRHACGGRGGGPFVRLRFLNCVQTCTSSRRLSCRA